MPRRFVLWAHPERTSFTAQWAAASCAAAGEDVLVSDLYGMGFDPAERGALYPDPPERFDPLKAQAAGPLPEVVEAEIAKLRAAEQIVLHFPLWWFAPPAMIKGWCERVLAHGATHDTSRRFDRGDFRGRRVLFCVTTGSSAAESGPDGREGDTRLLLWPLAMTFRYLGFDVAEPLLVHGVHGYHRAERKTALEARLAAVLDDQAGVIAGLESRALVPFNADGDFDGEGRLRIGAPSVTPFIRRG